MKNVIKKWSYVVFACFLGLFAKNQVFADTPYNFGLEAYRCDIELTDSTQLNDVTSACGPTKYKLGGHGGMTQLGPDMKDVQPGDVIMLVVTYELGNPDSAINFELKLDYDASFVSPVYVENKWTHNLQLVTAWDNTTIESGGYLPAGGTGWVAQSNDISGQFLKLFIKDGTQSSNFGSNLGVPQTGPLYYLYFKVGDSAQAGSTFSFSYDDTATVITNSSNVGLSTPTTTPLQLSVFGTMSNDASLKSVTVTSGSEATADLKNYPVTYECDENNTNCKYITYVPNHITSINLGAVANDEDYATIADGSVGPKTLSTVGDNEFTISVMAHNGSTGEHTVIVRRLSKLTTLSPLALTDANNKNILGTTSPNIREYNVTVPYKTQEATLTYTLGNPKAKAKVTTDLVLKDGKYQFVTDKVNQITIEVSAENCQYPDVPGNECTKGTYTINVTRTPISTVNTLDMIYIDEQPITTDSPLNDRYEYNKTSGFLVFETDKESVNITVDTTSDLVKNVSGTGKRSLAIGENTVTLTVTAEDGSTKDYTVVLYRKSNVADFKNLDLTSNKGKGTLVTNTDTATLSTYTYTYPYDATEVTVTYELQDETAIVSDFENPVSVPATKTISITVTAESGDVHEYLITLNAEESTYNDLDSLSITPGSLNETFSSSKPNYTATVEANVDAVEVLATTSYNAEISISGNDSLHFGTNEITVTVRPQKGSPKNYVITVTRKVDLNGINVNGTALSTFDTGITTYPLEKVAYATTSLELQAVVPDQELTYATVSATITNSTGTKNVALDATNKATFDLATGNNTIVFTVADKGKTSQKSYTLTVERTKNNDASIDLNSVTVAGKAATCSEVDNKVSCTVTLGNDVERVLASDVQLTTTDSKAMPIKVTGTLDLSTQQVNPYIITVNAEDETTTKDVVINITREKSAKNDLNSVTVTVKRDGEADYTSTCLITGGTCNLSVPEGTTEFELSASVSAGATPNIIKDADGKLTMPDDGTAKNVAIQVQAENGDVAEYTVKVNLLDATKSGNSYLSNITINGEDLKKASTNFSVDFDFDKNRQTYYITLDHTHDSVRIGAEVEEIGKAHVETNLDEAFPLEFKENGAFNVIEIVVRAADDSTRTYTLNIIRAKNNNAYLSDILVDGQAINGDQSFDKNKSPYVIPKVNYDKTSLTLKAIPEDLPYGTVSATITNSNGTNQNVNVNDTFEGTFHLATGSNTITLTVTAQNGTTKTYTINVERAKNTVTSVTSIAVTDPKINEKLLASCTQVQNTTTGKNENICTLPKELDNANTVLASSSIEVKPTDTNAGVTFENNTLSLYTKQSNDYKITVAAEDRSVTEDYILKVLRASSNKAILENITVNVDGATFKPAFAFDTDTYDVTVPVDTNIFTISAKAYTAYPVTYTLESQYELGSNSTMKIEIDVLAEDGVTEGKYTLNIKRMATSTNTLDSVSLKYGTTEYHTELVKPDKTKGFDTDVHSYTLTVPANVDYLNVDAVATALGAGVTGTGTKTLQYGENTITLEVEPEAGSIATYTIVVTREKKNISSLSSLKVLDANNKELPFTETFQEDKLEYTVSVIVPNNQNYVTVSVGKKDPDSTSVGNAKRYLKTGNNELDVVVTAQNGVDKTTYVINVERAKNNDATLRYINIPNAISFEQTGTFEYEAILPSTMHKLTKTDVDIIRHDMNADYTMPESIDVNTDTFTDFIVTVTAEDETTTQPYTLKVKRAKSSNALLQRVDLKNASLSPNLNENVREYTISVPNGQSSFNFTGINNYGATITGNGTHNVSEGSFQVTVQAEDGTLETYNFTIQTANSNDATLTNLSVTGYPFDREFSSVTTTYSIGNVPYSTQTLEVIANPSNANSHINYYVDNELQTSNTVNLTDTIGVQNIRVEVIAPDNTTRNYTIALTKVASSNANLGELKLSYNGKDDYKGVHNSQTTYIFNVPNEVEDVVLEAIAEDKHAVITINGQSNFESLSVAINGLTVGDNIVNIATKAQDNTPKSYTVIINRAAEEASTDATLLSLSVDGYDLLDTTYNKPITFNRDIFNYSIGEIPFKTSSLNLHAMKNDTNATITYIVNGVHYDEQGQATNVKIPLVNGRNAVEIKVTASDNKTVEYYKIDYYKVADTNAHLSNLTVDHGTLTYSKNTFKYVVEVGQDVDSLDLYAKTESDLADIQYQGNSYGNVKTFTIPLTEGQNTVTITSVAEDSSKLEYTVVINRASVAEKITSIAYGHDFKYTDDNADGYIMSVKINITALEMKNQLDNDNHHLEIWTADETKLVTNTDKLATGMIVKLIKNGKELDRKIIVIKGDTDGDGIIDLSDSVAVISHYLVKDLLTGAYKEAGYCDEDNIIDLSDSIAIISHYLVKELLH